MGSIWYFVRLSRSAEPDGPRVAFYAFQPADAIFAALLGLWFLFVIYLSLSQTKEVAITTAILVNNALFSFMLVGGVLIFLALRSLNPVDIFGLHRLTWSGAFRSLLALLVALPAIYLSYALVVHVFGADEKPQPLMQFFTSSETQLHDRWLLVFTAIVVAPLSEEAIFRGYFYGVIRRFGGRWPALILSAALFAAIHAHIPSFAPLFVLGLALTVLYEYTGSLWAPMLMHACFNATTIAISVLWPALSS